MIIKSSFFKICVLYNIKKSKNNNSICFGMDFKRKMGVNGNQESFSRIFFLDNTVAKGCKQLHVPQVPLEARRGGIKSAVSRN